MWLMGAVCTLWSRRRSRAALAALASLTLVLCVVAGSPGRAGASVDSDKKQIARLQQRIAQQGEHVKALVSRYNETELRLRDINAQIDHDNTQLAADRRTADAARAVVRRAAVGAYMSSGGLDASLLSLFNGATSTQMLGEQSTYLGAVNGKFDAELNALVVDEQNLQHTQSALRSEQGHAKQTLRDLTASREAAQKAIADDEATLTSAKGDLHQLLAAAEAQRAAQEQANERALASRAPSSSATPTTAALDDPPPPSTPTAPDPPPPPPPPIRHLPGSYANPLRALGALTPERIDQGVDYSGFGPIYAIGDGVVLSTSISGWPGGTYIAYRLTDGPAAGLVVYAAEDIAPNVQIGQSVNANTVLGQVYEGPDGIETGWGDPVAIGNTMARTYHQYHGGNSTAFGFNFSQLLGSVGAPGGVPQNFPPTGSLPPGWPQW